jgi:hypothetical protein
VAYICITYLVALAYICITYLVALAYICIITYLVALAYICITYLVALAYICITYLVALAYICITYLVALAYICITYLVALAYICITYLVALAYICIRPLGESLGLTMITFCTCCPSNPPLFGCNRLTVNLSICSGSLSSTASNSRTAESYRNKTKFTMDMTLCVKSCNKGIKWLYSY